MDVKRANEERMAAWMALMQAHAAVVAGLEDKLVKDRGLPLSWHEVLVHLAAAPDGKLRMQDLARSVLLSKSGVTRLELMVHGDESHTPEETPVLRPYIPSSSHRFAPCMRAP